MKKLSALVMVALLAVAGCGQVAEKPAPEGPTVQTRFGPVTVPANPKKIVAVGWSDAEAALALGVQPIAASDWLGFGGKGVGPWAADRYDKAPVILGTQELDFLEINKLKPDLILNTRSDNSEETHKELMKIAPTVAAPKDVVAYGTTWKQQMELVSTALGKEAEGDKLIAEVDEKLAAAKEANPGFAGKTVAVGAWFSDQYGAYVRGDSRADLMESLGFEIKPQIQELASGSFYIELSREQVEMLDADLTVVFPIGADASAITKDRVLNQIPAAKDGRMVVLEDKDLNLAFSSGSTLGTLYAVDNALPLFAKAAGGSGSS